MDLLKERDQFLAQLKRADFWRADQRFAPMFDRHTGDQLDAIDQKPCDTAKLFYSGVFAGVIYGAFAVLMWKWFW